MIDNGKNRLGIFWSQRLDKFKIIIVFAETDVSFNSFGRNCCARTKCDNQFTYFVIQSRQIVAYKLRQHRQSLVLNIQASVFDKVHNRRIHFAIFQRLWLKHDASLFGRRQQVLAFGLRTSKAQHQNGCGRWLRYIGVQFIHHIALCLTFLDNHHLVFRHHRITATHIHNIVGSHLRRIKRVQVKVTFLNRQYVFKVLYKNISKIPLLAMQYIDGRELSLSYLRAQ